MLVCVHTHKIQVGHKCLDYVINVLGINAEKRIYDAPFPTGCLLTATLRYIYHIKPPLTQM